MYNSIMCPFKSKQYEYSKRFHFYDAVFYPFYNLVVRNVSNQVNIHAEFRQQKNSRKLEENIFEIMKGKMDGKKMWMFKLQRKKKKRNNTCIFRNSNFNRLFIKHPIHHRAMHLRLNGAC